MVPPPTTVVGGNFGAQMGKTSQFDSFIIHMPDGIFKCRSCDRKGIVKTFSGSGGKSNIGRHIKVDHANELNVTRVSNFVLINCILDHIPSRFLQLTANLQRS